MKIQPILFLPLMLVPPCAAVRNGYDGPDPASFQEAVNWIRSHPRTHTQYNYVMTAKLRLLLFWVKRDDVGGGYIKLGDVAGDPRLQVVQLLFGSDPAKALHGINRWGAGREIIRRPEGPKGDPVSSVFFGFMKPSRGESSVSAMQSELSREGKAGHHLFEATISRVDPGRALYTGVPFYSDHDFDLHDVERAEQVAMARLTDGQDRKFLRLEGSSQLKCGRASGFLSTILQLIDDSLKDVRAPVSLCYVYNAHQYTATLESVHAVPEKTVRVDLRAGAGIKQTYRDLKEAHFRVLRQDTGRESDFDILVGTSGPLRGVPVQISYQPNWWFQVVLNLNGVTLHSEPSSDDAGTSAKP